ncbi:hypothetical protein BpOF4_04480 [Alkalihalophilus pseudofirmus OF4]|uniref:Cysteine-rich VLP domain-containing protein n=1 Tax=Alkalihalophilus pseudofirmus (strain ATCC BAA-2126 / JCM 17055 / OF4) TaxID=398511 RepID=D3FYS7_ALKPO|nr:hypothetical protein BpOF4_04480 [Alkalihalophilus pseudofirmus OF4]
MSLKTEIQRQVKSECATYAGNGRCLLDRQCPFFGAGESFIRCSYYENCVMPGDESLTARYWNALGNSESLADYCESCKQPFQKRSNAQKYCSSCQSKINAEQRRKRDREYRARKRRIQAEIS